MQAAVLCFINTVVQTAQGSNAKVFHQHEFMQAGFSPEDVEKVGVSNIHAQPRCYCSTLSN